MSAAGRMLERRHAGGGWARGVRPLLAALLLVVGAQRASAQTEVVEYYGQDALGSIRVVFDASGAAIARADYEPFGELFTVPTMPGTSELPAKQFTGQERDAEASLDYFGARFYQPRTGRFSEIDPVYSGLFDPQQWNRYAYVRNNPLSFVDPDGRDTSECHLELDVEVCNVVAPLPPLLPTEWFWTFPAPQLDQIDIPVWYVFPVPPTFVPVPVPTGGPTVVPTPTNTGITTSTNTTVYGGGPGGSGNAPTGVSTGRSGGLTLFGGGCGSIFAFAGGQACGGRWLGGAWGHQPASGTYASWSVGGGSKSTGLSLQAGLFFDSPTGFDGKAVEFIFMFGGYGAGFTFSNSGTGIVGYAGVPSLNWSWPAVQAPVAASGGDTWLLLPGGLPYRWIK